MANALRPLLLDIGNELALELANERGSTVVRAAFPLIGSSVFNDTVMMQAGPLVVEVVREVQAHANHIFSLHHLLTSGVKARAPQTLPPLTQDSVEALTAVGVRDLRKFYQYVRRLTKSRGVRAGEEQLPFTPFAAFSAHSALFKSVR